MGRMTHHQHRSPSPPSSHRHEHASNQYRYDSIEDFEAAFLCITNGDIGAHFTSKDELMQALYGCGRNPTKRNLDKYWGSNEKIGINEFIEIAHAENVFNERDLINAFKLIDVDEKGYISYKEFMELFTSEGDVLSSNEARKLLDQADLNYDKKLNYREFSRLVVETIERAKKVARKRGQKILKEKANETPLLKHKQEHTLKKPSNSHATSSSKSRERPSSRSNSRLSNRSDDLRSEDRFDTALGSHRGERRGVGDLRHAMREMAIGGTGSGHDDYNMKRPSSASDQTRHRHTWSDDEQRDTTYQKRGDQRKAKGSTRDDYANADYYDEDGAGDFKHANHTSPRRTKKTHLDDAASNNVTKQTFELKLAAPTKVSEALKEPKNLKHWTKHTLKGGFYFSEQLDSIVSNSYALHLKADTTLFLSIELYKTASHANVELMNMDACLLVVKDNEQLTLKGLTEHKLKNKWCGKLDLKKGHYFLFPFTSGCHLKRRSLDTAAAASASAKAVKLFKSDLNNKLTLSRQFRDALGVIFDMCDLDDSGTLSHDELNLYTFLTANEQLAAEDWQFVGETVGLKKNELTKDGFIQLYNMEAQRDDTDVGEVYTRLANLGFNKQSLTIDQSCPYVVSVWSESDFDCELLLGEIYNLKSAEDLLTQVVTTKGTAIDVKGLEGVVCFHYNTSYWLAVQITNESMRAIFAQADVSKSENCAVNLASRETVTPHLKIRTMKSKILLLMTPKNASKSWTPRITCSFK